MSDHPDSNVSYPFNGSYFLPSIIPRYLHAIVQAILLDDTDPEILKYVKWDNVLKNTVISSDGSGYNIQLIGKLLQVLQISYEIDFKGQGGFMKKHKDILSSIGTGGNTESIDKTIVALCWHYSPIVSDDGMMNIRN